MSAPCRREMAIDFGQCFAVNGVVKHAFSFFLSVTFRALWSRPRGPSSSCVRFDLRVFAGSCTHVSPYLALSAYHSKILCLLCLTSVGAFREGKYRFFNAPGNM